MPYCCKLLVNVKHDGALIEMPSGRGMLTGSGYTCSSTKECHCYKHCDPMTLPDVCCECTSYCATRKAPLFISKCQLSCQHVNMAAALCLLQLVFRWPCTGKGLLTFCVVRAAGAPAAPPQEVVTHSGLASRRAEGQSSHLHQRRGTSVTHAPHRRRPDKAPCCARALCLAKQICLC